MRRLVLIAAFLVIPVVAFLPVRGQILGPILFGGGGCSSLVLELPMTEGSGTIAHDLCGFDNFTITPGSGSWQALGGTSGSYLLNSTHMDAANNTRTNFNFNQPFSIFIVVNLTSCTCQYDVIGDLDTANNFRGWELGTISAGSSNWHPNFFLVNTFPSNAIQVNAVGTPNYTLHDILVTYDGSHTAAGVKFYIDGTFSANAAPTQDSLTTTTTNSILPRIGMRIDGTIPMSGNIAPVYIWNRVLTSGEASALNSSFYTPPQ